MAGQFHAVAVGALAQLTQPPLAGLLGRGAGGHGLGDQVQGAGVGQGGHLQVGQVPLGLQPGPAG
jgi:hypothetical protein